MPDINDYRKTFVENETGLTVTPTTYSVDDLMARFYANVTGDSLTEGHTQLEHNFLVNQGYTEWKPFLQSLGYTGDVNDMLIRWYQDGYGFLSQFPGASAAYSLRQIASSSTDVVRVRRNSDNAEQDFSATEVSNGTLLSWVGTGGTDNGFVTTRFDQTVPTSKDRMYFDGVDDTVIIGTPVIPDPHNFDIEFTVVGTPPPTGTYTAYGQGNSSSNNTVFVFDYEAADSGKLRCFIRNDSNVVNIDLTADSVSLDGTEHVLRVTNVNGNVTIYMDGVEDGSGSYTPSGAFTMNTGRIGSLLRTSAISFFKGSIYDVHLRDGSGNILASYEGYGIYNENWVDTAGSNNATVSGSPRRCLPDLTLANDEFQATASLQPYIVKDGAIELGDNGKPCIRGYGTQFLQTLYEIPNTNTTFFVGNNEGSSFTILYGAFDTTPNYRMYLGRGSTSKYGFGYGSSSYLTIQSAIDSGIEILHTAICDGTTFTGYINGANQYTNTPTTVGNPTGNDRMFVLAASDAGTGVNISTGYVQEIIIFESDKSADRVAIETNINRYWGVYP